MTRRDGLDVHGQHERRRGDDAAKRTRRVAVTRNRNKSGALAAFKQHVAEVYPNGVLEAEEAASRPTKIANSSGSSRGKSPTKIWRRLPASECRRRVRMVQADADVVILDEAVAQRWRVQQQRGDEERGRDSDDVPFCAGHRRYRRPGESARQATAGATLNVK